MVLELNATNRNGLGNANGSAIQQLTNEVKCFKCGYTPAMCLSNCVYSD